MGTCFYYIRCFRAILISAFRISLYLLAIYLLEGIQGNYLNLDFHAGLVLNFFPFTNHMEIMPDLMECSEGGSNPLGDGRHSGSESSPSVSAG